MQKSYLPIYCIFRLALGFSSPAGADGAVTTIESNTATSNNAETSVSQIVITPLFKVPTLQQAAAKPEDEISASQNDVPQNDNLPVIVPRSIHKRSYAEIYNSIPFSRTEYKANRSYRHEATMELLTGRPRPPKITVSSPVRAAPIHVVPLKPYNAPVLRRFFDTTRGPYNRYHHLFGYEVGYRPRYYHSLYSHY